MKGLESIQINGVEIPVESMSITWKADDAPDAVLWRLLSEIGGHPIGPGWRFRSRPQGDGDERCFHEVCRELERRGRIRRRIDAANEVEWVPA